MKKIILQASLASLVVFALVLVNSGCKKKMDTLAKITVRDANSKVVSGAQVSIYGESTENKQSKVNVGDTTTSNAAGEAIFNLNDLYKNGQAGVAVLNISAFKGAASGQGIIKIEENTTSEETVFIQE